MHSLFGYLLGCPARMVRQFPFFVEPPSTKTLAALAVHFLNLDLQLYFSEDNTCLEGCCPYPKTYVGE